MKVKDIRNLIKDLKDEDEVAIQQDNELWDCIGYVDETHGVTCLVIEKDQE